MESHRFAIFAWTAVTVIIAASVAYASAAARQEKRLAILGQLTVDEPVPITRLDGADPIPTDTRIEPELNARAGTETISKDPLSTQNRHVRTCPATDPESPDLTLFPISPTVGIGPARPASLLPIATEFSLPGGFYCLSPDAHAQFHAMARDARNQGVLLVVVSAYRSQAHQANLQTIGETDADNHTSVALPGHSEHQLGTTIDLTSGTTPSFTHHAFKLSSEYAWLQEHAAGYGFVQSYRPGDEDLTGYIAEPWHWRYIGSEHAVELLDQDIPLVTYLTNLATTSTDKKKKDGGN